MVRASDAGNRRRRGRWRQLTAELEALADLVGGRRPRPRARLRGAAADITAAARGAAADITAAAIAESMPSPTWPTPATSPTPSSSVAPAAAADFTAAAIAELEALADLVGVPIANG